MPQNKKRNIPEEGYLLMLRISLVPGQVTTRYTVSAKDIGLNFRAPDQPDGVTSSRRLADQAVRKVNQRVLLGISSWGSDGLYVHSR